MEAFSQQFAKSDRFSFMEFAQVHSKWIDKLVKENERRMQLEALAKRKVTIRLPTPQDHVQGRERFHYLIKMTKDPTYYEQHRQSYIQGLQ
jgi:hypothetical protein